MKTLHIAAAQIHSGGPVTDILARVERQVRAASAVGAEVLLFAEGALCGYDYDLTPKKLAAAAEPAGGPACRNVMALAKAHSLAILIGFFESADGVYYNSVLVARPDGSFDVQRKHVLNGGERKGGLTPGPEKRKVFTFNGVRTAIVICADGGIRNLHEKLKRQRVEYRFHPTGGGGRIADMLREADLETAEGREKYRENRPRVFKSDAILSQAECPYTGFTAANALGRVGRRTCHQGHCMIVDNSRVMRAQIPGTIVLEHMQDQMIHAELSFA